MRVWVPKTYKSHLRRRGQQHRDLQKRRHHQIGSGRTIFAYLASPPLQPCSALARPPNDLKSVRSEQFVEVFFQSIGPSETARFFLTPPLVLMMRSAISTILRGRSEMEKRFSKSPPCTRSIFHATEAFRKNSPPFLPLKRSARFFKNHGFSGLTSLAPFQMASESVRLSCE